MSAWRPLPPNYHSHEYGGVKAPAPILLWPGYMALPFLRAPLGYHTLSPLRVIWYAFGLLCCQTVVEIWLFNAHVSQYLRGYNAASAILALALWGRRWWRQGRPGEPHTSETGYSWLAWKTPLPPSLTEIFVAPALVGFIGWELAQRLDFEFGVWLILTGGSLFIMGVWEYRRNAAQRRAINDDMVRAGAYGQRVVGATQPTDAPDAGGQSNGKPDNRDFADLA